VLEGEAYVTLDAERYSAIVGGAARL